MIKPLFIPLCSAIRDELDKLVLADLHGPAGWPDEEGMANIAWLWTLSGRDVGRW